MTERKPHPDNAMIDELEDQGAAPSQGSAAGGDLQRDVGSRSELHNTAGAIRNERPHGQDAPDAQRTAKGEDTMARLQPGNED
jgi:hypothetical protein